MTYKDARDNISEERKYISFLGLIKHMAVAGQGYMPCIGKFFRVLGMFLRYMDYMRFDDLRQGRFSVPRDYAYDPTEMASFSNVIGKALADFLVKEIDSANLTLNYEAAMKILGIKIEGQRPDLLCLKNDGTRIAIEAKGRKSNTISSKDMRRYKEQAQSGLISVHHAVASVAYNLYDFLKVMYYDPNLHFSYDNDNYIHELIKDYYKGTITYLNKDFFYISSIIIKGNQYYVLRINQKYHFFKNFMSEVLGFISSVSILINFKTHIYAETGKVDFSFQRIMTEHMYIDTDGIGLMIQ